MKKRLFFIPLVTGALLCVLFGVPWRQVEKWLEESTPTRKWCEIEASDTLRVGTLRTSVSAYRYKNRWHGYEYDMAAQVASELGLTLDLHLMETEMELLDSLASGAVDLAAWPSCYRALEHHEGLRPCGYAYPMHFCTLSSQPLNYGPKDSARYHLAVVEGSRPWFLLRDTAFCAVFDRRPFVVDTLPASMVTPEGLVEQVAAGKYDATLVANNVGRLFYNFYQTISLGQPIGCNADSVSWMVARDADTLAMKIDSICRFDYPVPEYHFSSKYFFQMSNQNIPGFRAKRKKDGSLTGYDMIFKEYADSIGWDWRMFASLCMHESSGINNLISPKGAMGIMQLMPETAVRVGCPEDSIMDVRLNIRSASRLIARFERGLRRKIAVTKDTTIASYSEADSTLKVAVERDLLWFTLASYNSGMGQVFDGIMLAQELGYDPAIWLHNVEHCLRLKRLPTYYNMPCVRQGRFNASVTLRYVHDVVDLGEFWIAENVQPVVSLPEEETSEEDNESKEDN